MTEDIDEIYRRASALDPGRPDEAVRRKVLEHAAAVAAAPPRPAAYRARWRPAIFGTLAAAGLAGLLIIPRLFTPPVSSPRPSDEAAHRMAGNVPPPSSPLQQQEANYASRNLTSRAQAEVGSGAGAPDSLAAVHAPSPRAAEAAPPDGPAAALRRAAEAGDVPELRSLLQAEVRIDAPDPLGRTALMLAASQGRIEAVDVLLAHGADPNVADAEGTTPLQAALAIHQPAIAAALRRAGAR